MRRLESSMTIAPRTPLPATLALLAAAGLAAPALAQEEEGRAFAFGLSADGSVGRLRSEDDVTTSLSLYPVLDARLPFAGGWVAEFQLAPEAYSSGAGGAMRDLGLDDPYFFLSATIVAPNGIGFGVEADASFNRVEDGLEDETVFAFVEAPRWGRLAYGTLGSALSEYCVEALGESSNFATDDLLTMGTCESPTEEGTLLYRSPDFAGGFALAASVTRYDDDDLDSEAAAESASLALVYAGTRGAAEIEASLAVEFVSEFVSLPENGAGDLLAVQAGFARAEGRWKWAVSGAQDFVDDPAVDRTTLAAGLQFAATDRLSLGAGASWGRLGLYDKAVARAGHERSAGLTAEIALIPDRLLVDAALIDADRDFGEGDDTFVGVGFSYTF
jgi:hypothetical protein